MAQGLLEKSQISLPKALADELARIAKADAGKGAELAARLLSAEPGSWEEEVAILKTDSRFKWWLQTLAHSSLVVVLFRAPAPRRKLVKLSFEQPIAAKQHWLARLGWKPYEVGLDSSLIEARALPLRGPVPARAAHSLRTTQR